MHEKKTTKQRKKRGSCGRRGGEWWMWKWQEDSGKLIVLRRSLGNLGRVRSQGLWPLRAQSCQGNCATILTLHCLNLPSILFFPTLFFFNSLFPSLKLKKNRDLLSTLMMSAPQRRHLCTESQQLAFKSKPRPGAGERPGEWWRMVKAWPKKH